MIWLTHRNIQWVSYLPFCIIFVYISMKHLNVLVMLTAVLWINNLKLAVVWLLTCQYTDYYYLWCHCVIGMHLQGNGTCSWPPGPHVLIEWPDKPNLYSSSLLNHFNMVHVGPMWFYSILTYNPYLSDIEINRGCFKLQYWNMNWDDIKNNG